MNYNDANWCYYLFHFIVIKGNEHNKKGGIMYILFDITDEITFKGGDLFFTSVPYCEVRVSSEDEFMFLSCNVRNLRFLGSSNFFFCLGY